MVLDNYNLELPLRLMLYRSNRIKFTNNLITFKAPSYKLLSFYFWEDEQNMYDKFYLRKVTCEFKR
jgi:hypothetical protein